MEQTSDAELAEQAAEQAYGEPGDQQQRGGDEGCELDAGVTRGAERHGRANEDGLEGGNDHS